MNHPAPLVELIAQFGKLPGIGKRTAERLAYAFLAWNDEQRQKFCTVTSTAPDSLEACKTCNSLIEQDSHCRYCDTTKRDASIICIVASWKDVFAMESTHEFHGLYHVLKGTLSPLEGRGPETLDLEQLMQRLQDPDLREVIIALDSTVEGDATALYLQEQIQALNLVVSRLAFGIPMGSALDYVDGSTLAQALLGRAPL